MSISKKRKAEIRRQVKDEVQEIERNIQGIDGVYYKNDPKEDYQATVLIFVMYIGLFVVFLYRLYFVVRKGSPEYLETNGMIGTLALLYLLFWVGYLPEIFSYWKSTYRKFRLREKLSVGEKEHVIHFFLVIMNMVIFFGIVDFSFLGVKGGIPRIGSVALLSMWGFFRNVYRLRKANWEERKRKREHERHIERIRSRRNPPPKKQ